mmetsp:Transcript_8489/g.9577  ORF Transcript_8489/g.9577 Transcript_8489/m.9577 type:complete len:269 (+) Transcript_8489:77-883(+)
MNSLESKNDSFLSSNSESEETNTNHSPLRKRTRNESALKSGLADNVTSKGQSLTSKSSAFQSDFEDDMIYAKYHFYWFCRAENNKMYSVLVELQQQCLVREAIQQVIPYFNQDMDKKTQYKLAQDPDLYYLYSAKRSGQPKLDYPALDSTQNLNQTGLQNLCLVEKSAIAIVKSDTHDSVRLITTIQEERSFDSGNFSQTKPSNEQMVSLQPMPGSVVQPEGRPKQVQTKNEEVETYCCCLTKPKKSTKVQEPANESTLLDPLVPSHK